MAENGTIAYVTALPKCDLKCDNVAAYDGGLNFTSSWAYMCESHFALYGRGLGVGKGQRLVIKSD